MYLLGLFISLLIGVILGLVGGGGSILTVPLVHYIFGESMLMATTYSLFVVAVSASFGSIQRIRDKEVDFRKAFMFVVPSMITALIIRLFIMPEIPVDFEFLGYNIHRASIITILLIIVMLYTGIRTLVNKKTIEVDSVTASKIILFGVLTGLLSGFIGAGGGFIIVPILLGMGLDMKRAVATSMFIIAIQSCIALIGDFFNQEIIDIGINWPLLLAITAVTIIGVLLGNIFQKKVSTLWLKKAFSFLLIAVALALLLKL